MVSRLFIAFALLCTILIVSCDEDSNPVIDPPTDDVAPSAITDMNASDPAGNSVVLTWTAPGDDGMVAKASVYDIRYSTSLITDANWESATVYSTPPEPTVGGAAQSDTITGLSPTTKYYFAMRTGDEVPNWSGISNVDSATTHVAGFWTVYTTANSSLPSDTITDIAFQSVSGRWITTSAGLVQIEGDTWSVYNTAGSEIVSDDLTRIEVDDAGIKWIGSPSSGANSFNNDEFVLYNDSTTGMMIDLVRAIAIGDDDDVWFGSGTAGLFKFQNSAWTNFNSSNSDLFSNIIGALAFDTGGDLWIGYNFGGASKYDGNSFEHYNASSGFTSGGVGSIVAVQGQVWFATEAGVFVFDGSNWQSYNTTNSGLASNVVLSAAVDPSGDMWFGTTAGVSRFNGTNWTNYIAANSALPDNTVQAIAADLLGNIWIGTTGGLAVFND